MISKKNNFMTASFQDVVIFLLNSTFIKDPGNPKMIRNSKSVLKIMLCNLDKRVLKEVSYFWNTSMVFWRKCWHQ